MLTESDLSTPLEFKLNYSFPFPDDPGPDAQFRFIDNIVSHLYTQISRLKTYRNTIVPIFRLPDELLSQIFFEYASASNSLSDLKWTKLMLVCRRWHLVGMSTQTLWSFINIRAYDGIHRYSKIYTQLERSGTTPLSVKMDIHEEDDYLRELLKFQAERLQVFHVCGKEQIVQSFLDEVSRWRLPVLRSIEVNLYNTEFPEDGNVMHFPDALLDGRAPLLRSLRLDTPSIAWELLHDLTHLSLTQHAYRDDVAIPIPPFHVLLSTLERSPSLRTLTLASLLAPDVLPDNHPLVNLPHLENLELIKEDVEACTRFLSSVTIPVTTSIVVLPLGISHPYDIRELLIPLRHHFRSKGALTLRLLTVSCTDDHLTLAAYIDTNPVDISDDNPYLSINSHPHTQPNRRKIITKILHAIPVHTITHLDARFRAELTTSSWRTLLSLLPALHSLIIGVKETVINLAHALIEMIDRPRHNIPFPRLKSIHLDGFFIHMTGDPDLIPERVSAALIEMLTQYKAAGAPVGKLKVTRNHGFINGSAYDTIKGLVGEFMFVYW